jgi:elongation factor Tu
MDAIDSEIPEPVREIDKPFLMSVEDVFSITGRGTVATGASSAASSSSTRRSRSSASRTRLKTVVTGIEMFRKLLDQGQAGDNVGVLLRGIEKEGSSAARSWPPRRPSPRTRRPRPRSTS